MGDTELKTKNGDPFEEEPPFKEESKVITRTQIAIVTVGVGLGLASTFLFFRLSSTKGGSPPGHVDATLPDPGLVLTDGVIGFDVPKTMTQGVRVPIQVSLGTAGEDVIREFIAGHYPTVEPQMLSAVMSVELVGPGFKVTPLTSTRQAILRGSPTTWKFDVLPTGFGLEELDMEVNALLAVEDHPETPRSFTTERWITVKVAPTWMVASFVENHWEWAFGSLLVPPVAWVFKRFKKKPELGFSRESD
jgi:hypothetical protein